MVEKNPKNLIVATKSFARANPLPLDVYEVWESFEEAKEYSKSPLAYPGQTLKIKTDNGKYQTFIIQKDVDNNLILEETSSGENLNLDKLKNEIEILYENKRYEITGTPIGTLVDYNDKEIRVMCPKDVEWVKQNVGSTGNSNMYYMGFKAYAPKGAVSFKEGDRGVIIDEMFDFSGDFAGTDKYGRNYSIVWLALASYDSASDTWNYFGKTSSVNKYIGWTYVVEWYDKDGIIISSDSIRINLSNEDCHQAIEPYYIGEVYKKIDESAEYVKNRIGEISEDMTVKEYIDTVVDLGGPDISNIIAEAIKEAKTYTDSSLTIYEF
jgi:hypothetical protein